MYYFLLSEVEPPLKAWTHGVRFPAMLCATRVFATIQFVARNATKVKLDFTSATAARNDARKIAQSVWA